MLFYTNYLIKDLAMLFNFIIIQESQYLYSTSCLYPLETLPVFVRFDEKRKVSAFGLCLPITDGPASPSLHKYEILE